MNKLQKRAVERVMEILREGQQEMLDLAISKQPDTEIAREVKSISTTGTTGNRIYHKFRDAESWLRDIIGEK